jgi:cytochrome c peroxidase
MRRRMIGFAGLTSVAVLLLFFAVDSRSQNRQNRRFAFAGGEALHDALPRLARAPADNPGTPDKIALGRLLFWDPILSGHNDVACATCHHPEFGYAENRDLSIGVNGVGLGDRRRFAPRNSIPFVKRNSQTILNVAFNGIDDAGAYTPSDAPMFWDVRARSLEAQALEPIKTLEEMRGNAYAEDQAVAAVTARLNANAEYRQLFARAFGTSDAVTGDQLGKALAAFQRSLTGTNAPFDRYRRGDLTAMTDAQVRGMGRFERIGCANCHRGPMFSDYKVHVLGVPDNPQLSASDAGVDGAYAFRTASLRNLAYTAPYMHTGVFQSLREVLNFYDDVSGRRGRVRNAHVSREQLDPLLRQLRDPDNQASDVIAFLQSLSDDSFDRTIPARVPSGRPPGGQIQ